MYLIQFDMKEKFKQNYLNTKDVYKIIIIIIIIIINNIIKHMIIYKGS
jgi:hypothetical protein